MELRNNNRLYLIEDSCIFRDNAGQFGGLSNMSTGYPLEVNDIKIKTVEALYQACKFPGNIELQTAIISEASPFTAKMITRGKTTRKDWMDIRVGVMRWCLQVKLAQNFNSFGQLLTMTQGKNIVEYSKKDIFWGANKIDDNQLQGTNALGRLLMELRGNYFSLPKGNLLVVKRLDVKDFKLLGKNIDDIDMRYKYEK